MLGDRLVGLEGYAEAAVAADLPKLDCVTKPEPTPAHIYMPVSPRIILVLCSETVPEIEHAS